MNDIYLQILTYLSVPYLNKGICVLLMRPSLYGLSYQQRLPSPRLAIGDYRMHKYSVEKQILFYLVDCVCLSLNTRF